MIRLAGTILVSMLASLPLGASVRSVPSNDPPTAPTPSAPAVALPAPSPAKPEPPKPPTLEQALQRGVVIVVSKRSQQAYVFKDGALWGSSRVSTGRRGHSTPAGVFPILQKKVRHRSTIYSGAPMPYMQRLTWDGIALHAGHVPGYPASHGCIRLPAKFAKSLYGLTRASSTVVLVANDPARSPRDALRLAGGRDLPLPGPLPLPEVRLASAAPDLPALPATGRVETIQLAASTNPADAAAFWRSLQARQPRLAGLDETIVPAVVNGRRFYRLRASAPGAHGLCGALQRDGVACLKVSA